MSDIESVLDGANPANLNANTNGVSGALRRNAPNQQELPPFAELSEEALRKLRENPLALGVDIEERRRNLRLVDEALLRLVKKSTSPVYNVTITGWKVNRCYRTFYVVVDGETGKFYSNLSVPELIALQQSDYYYQAGFGFGKPLCRVPARVAGGAQVLRGTASCEFALKGNVAFVAIISDWAPFGGISQEVKDIAKLVIDNARLDLLKYGRPADDWSDEIDVASKAIGKLAKLTPLGDLSGVVDEVASVAKEGYKWFRAKKFRSFAYQLDLKPPSAIDETQYHDDARIRKLLLNRAGDGKHEIKLSRWFSPKATMIITGAPAGTAPEQKQRKKSAFEQRTNLLL